MRKEISILICTLCVFLLMSDRLSSQNLGRFKDFKKPKLHVFMLANQDYRGRDMDLRYSVSDMQVYNAIFKHVFKVPKKRLHFYKDISLDKFFVVTEKFKQSIKKNELVFIIYAGHGNTNGMPIFVDRRTIAPRLFFKFMNSFENDTVVLMDSCYSGAEGYESGILSSDNIDESTQNLRTGSGKEVKEKRGYRKNVLRIYSALAHQQAREANYARIKRIQKHLGNTYSFLRKLGYKGVGNGIFSITFASFFADQTFSEDAYTFDSLNSHINMKVSALQEDGFDSQRPKLVPWRSPFKNKKNFYLLYKNFERQPLPEVEKTYLLAVEQHNLKKNYQKAIELYRQTLSLDSGYKDTKIRIAECYLFIAKTLLSNSPQQVVFNLENALRYNPNQLEALNLLGTIYLRSKEYTKALSYYEKVLQLSKQSENNYWTATSYNNIGMVHNSLGDYDKAVDFVKQGLELNQKMDDLPGLANSYNNIGGLYYKKESYAIAVEYFNKAIKINQDIGDQSALASSYNNAGLAYLAQEEYSAGIKDLNRAVKLLEKLKKENEMAFCYINLGLAYKANGKYNQALTYLKKARKLNKKLGNRRNVGNCYVHIGKINHEKQDFKASFTALKTAIKIKKELDDQKGEADVLNILAIVYSEKKKYKTAIKYLNRSLKLCEKIKYDDGKATVYVNLMEMYDKLGRSYFKKAKYKSAIKYLTRANKIYEIIDDQRSISRNLMNIGFCHYKRKNYNQALKVLNRSLTMVKSLDEENKSLEKIILRITARVYHDIGIQKAEDEDYEAALENLEKAYGIRKEIKDRDGIANSAISIASIHDRENSFDKAIEYYNLALGVSLKSKKSRAKKRVPNIYFSMAMIYMQRKDYKTALKHFKKALNRYKKGNNKKATKKTLRQMGNANIRLGEKLVTDEEYEEAMSYFQKALKIYQKNLKERSVPMAMSYKGLAYCHYQLENYNRAIDYQKKFIAILKELNSKDVNKELDELRKMESREK